MKKSNSCKLSLIPNLIIQTYGFVTNLCVQLHQSPLMKVEQKAWNRPLSNTDTSFFSPDSYIQLVPRPFLSIIHGLILVALIVCYSFKCN